MMIRVKSTSGGDDGMVQNSIGRKGKNASYDLNDRGTLCMTASEWTLFKRTLERGAVRPVIVVIDEVEDAEPPEETQPVAGPDAPVTSPF